MNVIEAAKIRQADKTAHIYRKSLSRSLIEQLRALPKNFINEIKRAFTDTNDRPRILFDMDDVLADDWDVEYNVYNLKR
jgi:hypothetical protein